MPWWTSTKRSALELQSSKTRESDSAGLSLDGVRPEVIAAAPRSLIVPRFYGADLFSGRIRCYHLPLLSLCSTVFIASLGVRRVQTQLHVSSASSWSSLFLFAVYTVVCAPAGFAFQFVSLFTLDFRYRLKSMFMFMFMFILGIHDLLFAPEAAHPAAARSCSAFCVRFA